MGPSVPQFPCCIRPWEHHTCTVLYLTACTSPGNLILNEGTKFPIWTPSEPTQQHAHPPSQREFWVPVLQAFPPPPSTHLHAPSPAQSFPPFPALPGAPTGSSDVVQVQCAVAVSSADLPRTGDPEQPSSPNPATGTKPGWASASMMCGYSLRHALFCRDPPSLHQLAYATHPRIYRCACQPAFTYGSRRRPGQGRGGVRRGEERGKGPGQGSTPGQARPDHELTEHSTTTTTTMAAAASAHPPLITIRAR